MIPDRVRRRLVRALDDAGLKADLPPERLARAAAEAAATAGLTVAEWPVEPDDGPLLVEAVDRLTIQETSFFREPRQLKALAELVPRIEPPITVWCAGCANGQEAWSVAMLLHDRMPGKWRVVGTDLSRRAVRRAQHGVYRADEMRGLPALERARHMRPTGDGGWSVADHLRARVEFINHNVARQGPPVPLGSCQIVLCRNLLIYLSPAGVQDALANLGASLDRGGVLFVGAAESLWAVSQAFEPVRLGEAFAYRLRGATDGAAATKTTRPAVVDVRDRPVDQALPAPAGLLAQARQAQADGDMAAAAKAYRQAAYLDPDEAEAHAGLAVALDALGHPHAAARARAAARAAARRVREGRGT